MRCDLAPFGKGFSHHRGAIWWRAQKFPIIYAPSPCAPAEEVGLAGDLAGDPEIRAKAWNGESASVSQHPQLMQVGPRAPGR